MTKTKICLSLIFAKICLFTLICGIQFASWQRGKVQGWHDNCNIPLGLENVMGRILFLFCFLLPALSGAEKKLNPLNFEGWKRLQIHESRMKVVQLSGEIQSIVPQAIPTELSGSLEGAGPEQLLRQKQASLKTALENLQSSKELTFKDYFDVYLVKYSADEAGLRAISRKLSKDSVYELIQKSLKSQNSQPRVKPSQKTGPSQGSM